MPRKYTPPEQALKEYNDIVILKGISPVLDYDGDEILYSPLIDDDETDWERDIDYCANRLKCNSRYKYELTITFDRKIHTFPTMLDLQNHCRIIKYYLQETLENEIVDWYVVKEYHKNTIGALRRKPPHYHMLIYMEEEIEAHSLWKLNKAFNRHFGMNTIRPVEDPQKYIDYMCKDVVKNNKEYRVPHLFFVY